MPASSDKIAPCKRCGRVPFIISSRRRLHNLGLQPAQCYGCGDLLPPYIPDVMEIERVSVDNRTILQFIGEIQEAQSAAPPARISSPFTHLREIVRLIDSQLAGEETP